MTLPFRTKAGFEQESKTLCQVIIFVDNVDNFVNNVNLSFFEGELSTARFTSCYKLQSTEHGFVVQSAQ